MPHATSDEYRLRQKKPPRNYRRNRASCIRRIPQNDLECNIGDCEQESPPAVMYYDPTFPDRSDCCDIKVIICARHSDAEISPCC
jgi:hypothetical protein